VALRLGRKKPVLRVARAAAALAVLGVLAAAGFRAAGALGPSPRRVVLVYVREENSLGLTGIPSEAQAGRTGFVVAGGFAVLPQGLGRIPPGTKVLVVRETFVAGLLLDSRVVFLRRLPGTVAGRREGPDGAGGSALLGGDVEFRPAGSGDPAGGSRATRDTLSFSVTVADDAAGGPGGVVTPDGSGGGGNGAAAGPVELQPGREWRLTAVGERQGGVSLFGPGDPGCDEAVRQAFYDGRPVSVLSVLNLGLWSTDRIGSTDAIESGSDGEG